MGRLLKSSKHFKKAVLVCFIAAVLLGVGISYATNVFQNSRPLVGDTSNTQQLAMQAQKQCNESDKNHCYPQFFYELTKKEDIKLAAGVLQDLQKINPQDTNGCHFIAHRISQAEVEKNPREWKKVLTEVSPSLCTGGFLHGVLEVHASYDKEFEINNQTVMAICQGMIGKKNKFGERSCYHSMGHLILMQTEGVIDNAVNQCNTIISQNARYECLSGAFMETITQENLFSHGYIANKEPWNAEKAAKTELLCGNYSDLPAKACWKEISFLYFGMHESDPVELYRECQNAPTQEMRDECFIYGAGNVVHSIRFKPGNMISLCHQIDMQDPLFNRCMTQIIGSMLTGTPGNLNKVLTLCDQTYISYQSRCYSLMVEVLHRNNEEQQIVDKACGSIPQGYKNKICA